MNRKLPSGQLGVTVVELLVSLVIGLAIMAALSKVFVASKSSYSLQTSMSQLQENGRYALMFMQRDIRNAGQPYNEDNFQAFVPPTGAAPDNSADGVGSNGSDRIAIRYRAMAAGTDCLGTAIAAGTVYITTYSVATNNGIRQLMCSNRAESGPAVTPVAVVDGIEAMQVLYGIDTVPTFPDGDGLADRYVKAADVTTSQWMRQVVSVRIAVLSSTILPVNGDIATDNNRQYTLLDAAPFGPVTTVYGGKTLNLRARVFTTTVEVRNRTPVPIAPPLT